MEHLVQPCWYTMRKCCLSFVSGLALTLSFPEPGWYPLAWVAIVPLLVSLENSSYRESFTLGWIMGLTHFTTLLYWVVFVVHHYGKIPLIPGIGVLLLLASYLAIYPALASLTYRVFRNRCNFSPGMAISVSWVATELARSHFLTGFPWGLLGYSQIPWLSVVQSYDVFGVLGISFLITLANGSLYTLITQSSLRKRIVEVLVFVCLFGLNWGYGKYRIQQVRRLMRVSPAYPVALVQGDVPQDVKWDKNFQEKTIEDYEKLSGAVIETGRPRPRLIVWPETAVPFFFGYDARLSRRVLNVAKKKRVYVLFGAPCVEYRGSKPYYFNCAFVVSPFEKVVGKYTKEHLVPFGEYVPLKKVLFFVNKLAAGIGEFTSGASTQKPILTEGQQIGILICYEAIFPELALKDKKNGASILVNISNDAWFGNSSAPYQHLLMSRARAIETRLPIIRCTNTGISALINADGTVSGIVPLSQRKTLAGSVRTPDIDTLYARIRDVPAWCCTFFSLLVLLTEIYGTIHLRFTKPGCGKD